MTDETPPTPAPVAAPVPAAPVVKPPSLQISNYLGGIVAVVGNALPALTPDFLASLGFSAFWVHIFSSVIATALFVYQEKVPAAKAVPAPKQSGQAHVALLWVLAAATMITGNVVALWQQDVKRMLAYSSIAGRNERGGRECSAGKNRRGQNQIGRVAGIGRRQQRNDHGCNARNRP